MGSEGLHLSDGGGVEVLQAFPLYQFHVDEFSVHVIKIGKDKEDHSVSLFFTSNRAREILMASCSFFCSSSREGSAVKYSADMDAGVPQFEEFDLFFLLASTEYDA